MSTRPTPMNRPGGRRAILGLLAGTPFAIGSAVAFGTSTAAAAEGPPVPPGLRPGGEVDRLVRDLAAEGKFSGSVLITRRNQVVLERSVGLADRGRGIANTADTIFAVGSITKMFTAVAILRLAQEGRVELSAPLGTYLDGFAPEIAGKVTLHHMLTHTSGLQDYMRMPGFPEAAAGWDSVEETWEGALSFVRRDTLKFPPGGEYAYSNSAFYALGAIVAAVSGRSYYDYVRENVFAPAGMTRSDFHTKDRWRTDPRIARPYQDFGGGSEDVLENRHTYVGSPAGNSFATVGDLLRFKRALLGGELLSPAYAHVMVTPKGARPPFPPDPTRPQVTPFGGYGTGILLVAGRDWVTGHNGGAPGVSANLDWYTRGDWTAATLSNAGDRTTAPVDSRIRALITGT